MTPHRRRMVCHLTALLICLTASGCYIPGGGWTMRAGVDLRRQRKPSAFFELVDTRWDEYNRVAEMNLMETAVNSSGSGPQMLDSVPVPSSSSSKILSNSIGPSQPADGNPQSTGPADPRFDSNSTGENSTGDNLIDGEPSLLPGVEDSPASTPASTPVPRDVPPTARRLAPDGPPADADETDDSMTEQTVATAAARVPATKPARRPMASRLFSRPR